MGYLTCREMDRTDVFWKCSVFVLSNIYPMIFSMKNIFNHTSDWIAIVPAKGHSDAVQHKNLQEIGGRPLFWHSVIYARAEGVTPIVSTDDPTIKRYSLERGCAVVDERVDDSSQIHCIRQVLEIATEAQHYVVLQPTSPIRQPGLLSEMVAMDVSCAYTAQRIKIVGRLNDQMEIQTRRQDASLWLWQYDGSMMTGTREMAEASVLFTADALPIEQRSPYTMQIDSIQDLTVVRAIYDHLHCR